VAVVVEGYPALTKDDLAVVWRYADTHRAEIDEAIRRNESDEDD
jgi:uncharacterized protein (DUF433 family)